LIYGLIRRFFSGLTFILFFSIIHRYAGEIIGEAALAINMKLRPFDIFGKIHPHLPFPNHLWTP
jgi:pyruvate/2-oxoglutarate dehydrogenase complex dihydrolipoamide dehydrogenase (E3) component